MFIRERADGTYEELTIEEYAKLLRIDPDIRRVALDTVDGATISTVWLGIDHRFDDIGEPLIYETMIFTDNSGHDQYMERYSHRDDALERHKQIVDAFHLYASDAISSEDLHRVLFG